MRAHPIRSRRLTLVAAVAAFAVGSWLLWDAYEGRGHSRPFLVRAATWP